MDECVFCKIAKGTMPTEFRYNDDSMMIFASQAPRAPVHLLIVPKRHVADFVELGDEGVLKVTELVSRTVSELGLAQKGYRIVINGGAAKSVPHLHVHLLGEVTSQRDV